MCNGVDDDCSGTADEDYVSLPTTCGVGACASTGSTSCVSGSVVDSCAPGTPAADDSLCNGIDDDCNGAADEDYVSLPTTCGVGACASTGSTSCASGAVVDRCTPGTPAANDATCDGVDDDCSGQSDEDFVSTPTSCGIGACASTGTTACVSGSVVDSCTPGTPAADDLLRNGIDDDCDNQVDEEFVSTPTNCGIGACASADAVAAVRASDVIPVGGGGGGADDDSPERGLERVGPCVLVCR